MEVNGPSTLYFQGGHWNTVLLFSFLLICFIICRYLQEIGYTDTVIDVRSARVRSLLGLQSHNAENEAEGAQPALVNGEMSPAKRNNEPGKTRYFWIFLIVFFFCFLRMIYYHNS